MPPRKKFLQLEKVCRACLSDRIPLKPIFETRMSEMMMACASITVAENDNLPKQICSTCYTEITKFFKFKKKLERSDASLRLQLKEMKMANIITQAANDADIELTADTHKTDFKTDTTEDREGSDDDEPLSVRRMRIAAEKSKRLPRNSKTKANKLIDSVVSDINEYSDLIVEVMKEDTKEDTLIEESIEYAEIQSLQTALFTSGPPPLVPLEPLSNTTVTATEYVDLTESAQNITLLKPMCEDTPPLVPIKPLTVIEQVAAITNLNAATTQRLELQCSVCYDEFSNVTELRHHLATHACDSGSNLVCNICKKDFSDKKRLIGHLKRHMIAKQYGCKLCGKRYPNPSTFRVHMRTHTGERPFKCHLCGKGFIRYAGVIGHMKSHTSATPYKCDQCQKGFKFNSNLERHKMLHTGEMPFCCSYCGKTFSQSDNLHLHVRTYHTHERPYLCSECGKGFVSAPRLNRHMWMHTGYKPYRCAVCDKSYANSNDLKNHQRTHSGAPNDADKPYACTQCNLRFYHQCRLSNHMKTHEKPFACTDCPKTFTKQNVLNRHVANKHSDEQILLYKTEEIYLSTEFNPN